MKLILKKTKSIRIIDYEFCGNVCLFNENNLDWRPFQTSTPEEKKLLDEQIVLVGGVYRSPFGLGCFENDLYAVNHIVFSLKKRKLTLRQKAGFIKGLLKEKLKIFLFICSE